MRVAPRMTWVARKPFTVFARGTSLRRRVAYSLGLVRLILAPVILLTVYYIFAMGWIVDRIVSVDAPMATQAQQISLEMLEALRGLARERTPGQRAIPPRPRRGRAARVQCEPDLPRPGLAQV